MGALWEIQPLGRHHDRTSFDCGNAALDDWLRLRASQFQKKDLARTYVAVRPGDSRVEGYYALASHHVMYEALAGQEQILHELQIRVERQRLIVDVPASGEQADQDAGDPQAMAVLIDGGRDHVVVEPPQSSQNRKIAELVQSGPRITALTRLVT